jgi:putative transposase
MILGLQQGLKEVGFDVSVVKLCTWFGVARRTFYYRGTKGQPKL